MTLFGSKKNGVMKRKTWFGTKAKRGSGRTLVAALFLGALFPFSVGAQEPDTLKGPEIHIRVNKETDDQGNVIRYDSTYTWFWSSGDTLAGDDTTFFRRFFSGPGGWHFGPGMLVPDSLPGFIFSPFDEDLDPFFFGIPDTSAIRHMEELFRRFMEPLGRWPDEDLFRHFGIPGPGELFPEDTLAVPVVPPGKDHPETHKKKGKVIIL